MQMRRVRREVSGLRESRMRFTIKCRQCAYEFHAGLDDAFDYSPKGGCSFSAGRIFFATCEDCEGKTPQQPAPSDERSPKTVGSSGNEPPNVVPEEETIGELYLTIRAHNALSLNGIYTIGQLLKLRQQDLLRMPTLGRKSFLDIKEALAKFAPDHTIEP